MNGLEPTIKADCPKCGNTMTSDGENVGIGYVYPPFHCECGYSDLCAYENAEKCKICTEYKSCYRTK